MNPLSPLLILVYAFTLWLGMYLIQRGWENGGARYAGLGLIAFDLGLLAVVLLPRFNTYPLLALVPAICWFFSVRHFAQPGTDENNLLLPDRDSQGFTARHLRRRRVMILVWVATVFFTGSVVLLLLPLLTQIHWLSIELVLVLMGIDLLLLGWGIAILYADDQGQALLPDALRSLVLAALGVGIFGGQVAAAIQIGGESPALTFLLYSIITVTILVEVFAPLLQHAFDTLTVSPGARQEREALRAVYNAIPRRDETLNLLSLDEVEFARLTRRALSQLGDLEGLAGSPLLYLPQIDAQLAEQNTADSTLARTTEIKSLLICKIAALKPQNDGDFGTTDAWRYYNALHYPYVVGIKPYRISPSDHYFDADTRAALQWFREQVPERTLYNWQNKAAQLIARDLREGASIC